MKINPTEYEVHPVQQIDGNQSIDYSIGIYNIPTLEKACAHLAPARDGNDCLYAIVEVKTSYRIVTGKETARIMNH